MSLAWSVAAQGARVVPCVLIAGLPVILIPEGVTLTGWTAGTLDTAWWPGSSFGGFSSYLRSWLSLDQPVEWQERAQPVQPEMLDVGAVSIRIADIGLGADGEGGLATALFGARDSVTGTWIAADVTTTTTVVEVGSTQGFASSGFLYVGRETMAYSSLGAGPPTFAVGSVANRGKFGSPVQHHWYTGNGNAAIANPEVTTAAPEIIGRTATVWLLQVSEAGVVTNGELAFYGTIGTGIVLSDEGEAWTLRLDHVIKRLATPLRGETVNVSGYVHRAPAGNRGAGASNNAPGRFFCPTYDFSVGSNLSIINIWTLTEAAAAPDNGGWHPDAESYVRDLSLACSASGAIYRLNGNRKLSIATNISPGSDSLILSWPWDVARENFSVGAVSYESNDPFPDAWIPVFVGSRIYLNALDYALIPAVPSSLIATVYYALALDGENDSVRYAKITAKGSSGSVYYVDVDAVARDEAQLDSLGLFGPGFIVTKPTAARIVCYVSAADWVSAIEAVITSFDTSLGDTAADAFDFDDMRDVVSRFAVGPYGSAREYVVDLGESVLDLLTRECRLNGFTLVLKSGRISIARFADFAPSEPTAGSIGTADLHIDEPRPQYSRGFDGIVNAISFTAPPPLDITVNVVDATSLSRYGAGRAKIEATAPVQIGGTVVNPAAEYLRLAAQAMQVLGPMRYPYEHITLTTPLHKAGFSTGDLINLTLWRVPNQTGSRGLTSRLGQVIGREVVLYDMGEGRVQYTLRTSPARIQGWAPAALVDELGISGADISLDLTTFGPQGFAPGGTVGGADYFEAGDVIRLVQLGTQSPTTSTQHTVASVSGSTLTVSPNPNATFVGLATTRLAVMVIADDWGAVTASQQVYAYLADTSYRLDTSTQARVYSS